MEYYRLEDLDKIISAVSVLLIFLAILFEYIKVASNKILDIKTPSISQVQERKKLRKKVENFIFQTSISFIIFIVSFYILLPTSVVIIDNSSFSIWNFDILRTFFILINLGILTFTIVVLIQTIKLLRKRGRLI